jgi:gliding motility-associated-like protein
MAFSGSSYKKSTILFLIFLSGNLFSQVEVYPFSTQNEYNSWNPFSTDTPNPFSYNISGQSINYNEYSVEYEHLLSSQLLKQELPFQLVDNFRVSFKVRKQLSNSSNTYFPLLLTQNILTGAHQHPWRLGPYQTPTLGNQQNVALIGVVFTHNNVGFLHRQHQSNSGQIQYLNNFSMPSNTDLWIRIEKTCSNGFRLTVFNTSTMDNTPLADQFFNYSSIAVPLGALYIANCNGNGELTQHNDLLDEYRVQLIPNANVDFDYTITPPTCSSPGEILVTNITGGTAPYSVSFNGGTTSGSTSYTFTTEEQVTINVHEGSGCSGYMNVDLSNIGGTGIVNFPNVFTPNKDGVNDKWMANGSCIRSFSCTILNRWGDEIEQLDSIDQGWDGKSDSKECVTGIYFYSATVEFTSGEQASYHGFIHLNK